MSTKLETDVPHPIVFQQLALSFEDQTQSTMSGEFPADDGEPGFFAEDGEPEPADDAYVAVVASAFGVGWLQRVQTNKKR